MVPDVSPSTAADFSAYVTKLTGTIPARAGIKPHANLAICDWWTDYRDAAAREGALYMEALRGARRMRRRAFINHFPHFAFWTPTASTRTERTLGCPPQFASPR